MRSSIKGLLGLALLTTAVPAFAQEAEESAPPITVTGGVTVVTDYRFRGVSFSDEDFAVQPTLTVNHESGLYAGVWGSNLFDTPVFGEVEVDLFAGYATEIASGTTLDTGVTYYWYPDGTGNSDYFEPYVSVRHTFGPTTVKVGAAYAWSQSALGNSDNIYAYADLTAAVPDTPVTLVGHVGYSNGSLAFGADYWDWAAGIDVSLSPFTLGVRYIDTDLDNFTGIPSADTLYDATVLFTLGVSF
jgi:uncharacterized protein (TIGR02001 family)